MSSGLQYPLHRTTAILQGRIKGLVQDFERLEFSFEDVYRVAHAVLAPDHRLHNWPAAFQELARQGKIQLLPGDRFRAVPRQLEIPPQTVTAAVSPSVAEVLDRHRQDAQSMAGAYATLYLLENGLRDYIVQKLEAATPDWWDDLVPRGVKDKAKRLFDGAAKTLTYTAPPDWAALSPSEHLNFATFDLLKDIITANWAVFEPAFRSQTGVVGRLAELEPIRNAIAHMRPLSQGEQTKLEMFANDVLGAAASTS